ncbi:MAG: CapA family protein, partial [Deltaproteobacteria bacterium]|nr:CapA family protein [Deltaproteobacteria bacterium]
LETIDTLQGAGMRVAGAGRNLEEARRPARLVLPGGRFLLVFGMGTSSSGIPRSWSAQPDRPGVDLIPMPSEREADEVAERVARWRQPGDLALVSLHWGSNWGYEVAADHIRFAHRLVEGGVDVVHGHSSHHPRPVEVYRHRLILYGCGDFINDYEGIAGYEEYRSDLVLMYLAELGPGGALEGLQLVPFQLRKLRLCRASFDDARWLEGTLNRASASFGTRLVATADATLSLVIS